MVADDEATSGPICRERQESGRPRIFAALPQICAGNYSSLSCNESQKSETTMIMNAVLYGHLCGLNLLKYQQFQLNEPSR